MNRRMFLVFITFFCFSFSVFCLPTPDDVITASKKNDISTINIYLQNGGNPNCYDKDGFTPIMFAALNNYVELAKLLVSKPNVNLNLKNAFGYSALTLAVVFGNTEVADILKKAGAKE